MPTVINTSKLALLIDAKFGSYAAFAKACGVSKQYMYQILKGDFSPSLERAIQFAELLDCSVDDIIIKSRE